MEVSWITGVGDVRALMHRESFPGDDFKWMSTAFRALDAVFSGPLAMAMMTWHHTSIVLGNLSRAESLRSS